MRDFILAFAILTAGLAFEEYQAQHRYGIQTIDTDQRDGRVIHDYVRVDITTGTICSLAGIIEVNDVAVPSCNGVK